MNRWVFTVVIGVVIGLNIFQPNYLFSAEVKSGVQDSYYAGKNLTFIVTSNPGGSYDIYARTLAPYLTKYLGCSTITVNNVRGAGHIKGLNELFEATPDGLTIGMGNIGGVLYQQLTGQKGIRFDVKKFTWLLNPITHPRVLVIDGKAPYKDILEMRSTKAEIKAGGGGVGATSYTDILFLKEILGINFKAIPGYQNTEDALLGIQRGEITARIGTYSLYYKPLIENGTVRPVLLLGSKDVGSLPPTLKSAIWLQDIVPQNKRNLAALLGASSALWGPIAAPPGMSANMTTKLKENLEKALNDPAWIEAASKVQLVPRYEKAEIIANMVAGALDQSPEMMTIIKKILSAK